MAVIVKRAVGELPVIRNYTSFADETEICFHDVAGDGTADSADD